MTLAGHPPGLEGKKKKGGSTIGLTETKTENTYMSCFNIVKTMFHREEKKRSWIDGRGVLHVLPKAKSASCPH